MREISRWRLAFAFLLALKLHERHTHTLTLPPSRFVAPSQTLWCADSSRVHPAAGQRPTLFKTSVRVAH